MSENKISLKSARGRAARRILIIPHGGGSVMSYRPFAQKFSDDVEVLGYEPPGRGLKFRDAPCETFATYFAEIESSFSPFTDLPFAIFGYSMGSLAAYELAVKFLKFPLKALAVCATNPPSSNFKALFSESNMTDEKLLQRLEAYGGTDPRLLASDEMRTQILNIFRSDMKILQSYSMAAKVKLSVPLVASFGESDPFAKEARAWGEFSQKSDLKIYSGGHFFLLQSDQVQREVVDRILANF